VKNLESSIANLQKNHDNITLLHEMMTLIIAIHEIPKFKLNKLQTYHDLIHKAAGLQVGSAKAFEEYWNYVLSHDNVGKIVQA